MKRLLSRRSDVKTRVPSSTWHTVNIQVKNILGKLGPSGRTEAVALALKKGVLQLD